MAFAVARSAHVHAKACIAVGREVRVVPFVPGTDHVPLAVGDVFEDRGDCSCSAWQPNPRRKPHSVRHRNPLVLDFVEFENLTAEICCHS